MKRSLLSLALLMGSGLAPAGERPADFATRLPIDVPPGAALVRITLPEAAYAALAGPDLADLRIFNGAGEALPVTRLPAPREISRITAQTPLLALPDPPTPGGEARLRISRTPDGTLLRVELDPPTPGGTSPPTRPARYLADLQPLGHPITAVVLNPAEPDPFEGSLSLETSDDLARWQSLGTERVLAIGQGATRVERLRIELPGIRARYLRLTWTTGPAPVGLASLALEHSAAGEAPRQWLKLSPQPGDAPGEWRYAAPGLFPFDRLRVEVEANSVAQVRIASRASRREPWRFRGGLTTYRIKQPGGEIAAPDHVLPLGRDPLWQLTLEPPGGAGPTLALGWQPETLVFAARGEPPYTLALGQARLPAAFLPVASLIPGHGTERAPVLADGRVLTPANATPSPIRRDAPAWQDGRGLALWAVLVLGVGVLGWMAAGLVRARASKP